MSFSFFSSAQTVDEEDEYTSEWLFGYYFSSNGGTFGGGIMGKYNRQKSSRMYESFAIDIGHIKNPRELRLSTNSGTSFILGKKNYFYPIRLQYGRDIVLFKKVPEEGVRITANFSGGPSLGMLVPYYILYQYGPSGVANQVKSEAYDPEIHDFNRIVGTGSFLQGLGSAKFLIGGNIRAGVSLDFGAFGNTISGVAAGVMLETFNQTPEILISPFKASASPAKIQNQQIFTTAYLCFFFGSRK
ncbi:MAG: hypothetical protein EAZ20_09685 [Bacteroidetes bacterium]|nr:MAG: hypothetical protein EAZ20_09685 [Bacteroidota bacterium]